ncbi:MULTISPECIES: hypothetical protein [unclassified Coleofasciculus]|uniref:hypothetical protein n=1 Tax=Cyanophyceae TaxID=3028117 RepID=UPI001685BAD7|nr:MULTISPECIES: hypothetical protein [unclassified Coleofasciculus]MBD1881438.1 hypothetical protein [Coleofasciculus sp. FACHB-T130]MBD1897686.1 hypothetical protein [Coleofasciculus sp. FACHB-129]
MNALWPRFLKSAYRKEPISSFVVIVGTVDAVIGGVDESWGLFSFGVLTVGAAIALRWWQTQGKEVEPIPQTAKHFLPPPTSRPVLPMLSNSKHHPKP